MSWSPASLGRFRRAFALLLQQRRQVLIGLLCVPAAATLLLWMPVVLGQAIDGLRDPDQGAANLTQSCLLFAGLALAEMLLRFVARHQLINASRRMEEQIKTDLLAHISRLPIAWFDRARTGDLISRATQDVELLRFVTGPALLYGGQAVVIVPGGIYMMLSLSPLVAAAALLTFGGLFVGMRLLLPRLHRSSAAVQAAIGVISQRAAEDFAGIRVLLAFGRASGETATMRDLCQAYLGHNMDMARLRALINLLIHSMRDSVVLAVLVLGALEAIAGHLTIGELLQSLALLGAMVWPMLATGWLLATFHRAAAAADRLEQIFAVEPEAAGGQMVPLRGQIEVRDLSFTYEGETSPALANLSFELEPDRKLGIVGPVGSGKSTLLALLVRLYDPPRGTMFVDGIDVLDIDPRALRQAFAFAPQDPFLFSDTIAGNIEFGVDAAAGNDPMPTAGAVHAADLEVDLSGFDDGLQTVVGERGITLSGGQKQRVSLARALASQRRTLVLDDSLSAVDHGTERRILERLATLRGLHTVLVVAHRLSAVRDADLILVLDRGELRESGRHDELLGRSGFYAETWRRQSESQALEREQDN